MYIYIYIYVYTYVYIYIYIYTHAYNMNHIINLISDGRTTGPRPTAGPSQGRRAVRY